MSACLDNLHRLSKYQYLRVTDTLFTQLVNIVADIETILIAQGEEIKKIEKKDYDGDIARIDALLTTHTGEIASLSETVETQGTAIQSNTENIRSLSSGLSNAESSISTLSTNYTKMRQDLTDLERKDFVFEAPKDGNYYTRKDGAWVVVPIYTVPGESGAWIKCSNGKYIDPEDYNPAMDVTPIGIAIRGTFTDYSGTYNYAMTVSLVYMDVITPDTGAVNPESPWWGNNVSTTFDDLYDPPDYNGHSNASLDFPSDVEGQEFRGGKYKTNYMVNLSTGQPNWKTDQTIINSSAAHYYPAACCAWRFHPEGTSQGDWWLPSAGEAAAIYYARTAMQAAVAKLGSNVPHINFVWDGLGYLRTATEVSRANNVVRCMATEMMGFNYVSEAKTANRKSLAITAF